MSLKLLLSTPKALPASCDVPPCQSLQGHYFDIYVNSPQFPQPWAAPQMAGINPLEFQKAKQARLREREQQAAASAAGDLPHKPQI